MNKATLDAQADAIDAVLDRNNIVGRCVGGTLTHRKLMLEIALQPGTTFARVQACAPHFARVLGVSAVRIEKSNGGVLIVKDIVDSRPLLSSILQQYAERLPSFTAILGLDGEDAPLMLRIPAVDVRSAVCVGGRCKSLLKVILESLIAQNAPSDLQIVGYKTENHGWTGRQPEHTLLSVQREIARRAEKDVIRPLLVVAIPDLTQCDPDIVADIVASGPTVGVHVLAASATEVSQKFGIVIRATDEKGGYVLSYPSGTIPFTAALCAPPAPVAPKHTAPVERVENKPAADTAELFAEIEALLK